MTTIPAFTIGGFTRPELYLDPSGNIILDPTAQAFVDTYGLQYLYIGCPPGTPFPPVPGFLSTPTDTNAASNTVVEGAAANTSVNLTAHSTSLIGLPVTYSLTSDSSSGGFKIDSQTGVVSISDPSKVDFESSGGSYTVTVRATDGIFVSSQSFTIAVTNAAPSTPVDSFTGDTVAVYEGAAAGTVVGINAFSTDVNGPAVTYSLTADTSNGGFKIDPNSGIVTVNDPTKIDFESAPGHAYVVTVTASDGHGGTSSQNFTIGVYDVAPAVPTDSNAAADSVTEGAAAGSAVGITASAPDVNGGTVHYALTNSANGAFQIDANTGVITVADPTKIDYESAPGHAYTVTVQASDGTLTSTKNFTIAVADAAPSTLTDSNAAANTVVEGAAAGTIVGITAAATDVNGGTVHYALTNSANGAFQIDANTGVITVADPSKIDFETAPGHAYTVTAQASDGTLTSSQNFTIAVTDVAPSTPVDSNASANTVAEGAAAGTTVGITASSTDINGPAVTWSLTGDTSGGGFTINATTGVITVADPTKIDYETSPGHAYTVTAQASDGTLTSSQTFTIGVSNVSISTPVDANAAANSIAEGAAAGSTVGITASAVDPNGPATTYALVADSSLGGFTINATTGVVTVADPSKLDYESAPGHAHSITVQATSGADVTTQTFTIALSDVAPSAPVDSDATANSVIEGAAAGTAVGITATASDINGGAVTYSLVGDTSGGGFTINAATGVITVADPSKLDFETAAGHAYTVTAQASDGTLSSTQTFSIAIGDIAPSLPVDSDPATNSVVEGAAAGTTVGVTASATDVNGPPVTWSLTGDTSGGGFTIDANTGVITVADPSKLDFETSGGSYSVTAQATDGTLVSSQTFTITVADVAPSTPVDSNAGTNTVAEGAANGSTVGITASSTDVNGAAVTYSLIGDTSGGGFTINAATGVITVADSTKLDYESSGGSYTVIAQASDGTLASSQTFTIAVSDVAPSTPVDSDPGANQVAINSSTGASVGVTASSTDVNGPPVTYSLVGDTSGGGFTIDATTGKVTVADPSKILLADPFYDITVDASDGTLHSQQTFTIAVVIDAAPVVTAGHTLNYTENQAATAFDPAITVTDSDTATLTHATVQITGGYVNGQDILAFVNTPNITGSFNAATGTLTLTGTDTVANYQVALAAVTYFNSSDNPSGAARTVTIIANDGTLDSSPVTGTINVTPVNDPPSVTAGHTLSYTENQAATAIDPAITVSDLDSANLIGATVQITGNYANGQDILAFLNTANITGSFNAATGILTLTGTDTVANYQAALASVTYFNNSDNPSGLARTVTFIANDGAATSTPVTGTINVTPVNDAPVTTAGGTLNYTENQAATAIDATVNVTDADSANLSSATVQITGGYVSGQDILGFTNQNGISGSFNAATGTLTLTGSSSVANYKAALDSVTYFNNSDNPSGADRIVSYTVNDGSLNSNTSTSTIHVTPVNDAPSINATGTLAYTENQGAAAVAPALLVTDVDTATLSSATVQISANYVNGEDFLGFANTANITGSFDAATGTLTLTGTDTVANYEAALRSVTYTDNSENPSTAARTVTFTVDDGQAVNHQSAGSNHTINVTAVDDAPINNGVPASFTVMSGFTHDITGLSISDVDAAGGNDITTTLTSAGGGIVNIAAVGGGAAITGNGTGVVTLTGTIAQINASLAGTVTYTAADGATGSSTTTITMATNDHGHTGTGGPITDTDVIQVGVTQQVWFIDQAQTITDATAPRGSQANPFTDIHEFNTSTGPGVNDIIYLKAGTYTGEGINLQNGQTLLGDDQALSLPDPFGGPAIQIETSSGARPTINVTSAGDQGIDLAQNNVIHGINITTGSGTTGLDDGNNSVGNLTVDQVSITGSGQAVDIDQGGNLNVALGTVSSSGGAFGVQLGGALTGSFSATGGTLSGHTTSEFDVSGGTGNISYGGAIGDGTGSSVSVANHTGGTVGFSGTITDGGDAGGGVSLTSNTGATINFTGGMTLNTGGSSGFAATGGGTVNVTGTNHITSTTGTALNITGTTIGASNVTFQDISANGAANGIVLNNTGTSGHLVVTGVGTTAGSGGTIQNTTGDGVSLTSTQDVTLSNMNITGNFGDGIGGSNVNGMVLNRLTISGNGDDPATDESGINITGLTGTASNGAHATSISNSTISNNEEFEIQISNSSGTLTNLQLINNTISANGVAIHGNASSPHGNLVNFLGLGTSVMGLTVNGGSFTGNTVSDATHIITGTGVFANSGGTSMTANIFNATFTNNNAGVDVSTDPAATSLTFDIEGNTFLGQRSTAINHFDNGNAPFNRTVNGTIRNNIIGDDAVTNSGSQVGSGIVIQNEGAINGKYLIDNNTISQIATGPGISVNVGLAGQATGGGETDLTITNNTIQHINGSRGITIQDNQVTDIANPPGAGPFPTIWVNMSGNDFNNIAGQAGNGQFVRIRELNGTVKVTQDSPTAGNAATELDNANGSTDPTKFNISGTPDFGQGAAPLPTTNPLPLLSAPGGVEAVSPSPGAMHLTQSQLDGVVAAAIAQWAAAGASAAQLAALHATTFSVADLAPGIVGAEQAPAHITIDVDADGHGWFIDPTPSDNSEFAHAANAAGTDLFADPTSPAAGHLDLLTAVSHELGHVLGLPDTATSSNANDLMHISLVDGERRMPDAADVAQANAASFSFAAVGARAPAAASAPNFVFAANAAPPQTAGDANHAAAPALSDLFSGHVENNGLWWAASIPAHTDIVAQTTVDHHIQPGPYQHDLLV
ncbi:cadherin domain-containing protein [Bradyrhizobium sp. WSM 1704]|uniref:cadherin domain-containing protein n=1 Tax=Bradyrhizobium semiaridum TaxID=2821404 RepID=UPI001CE377B4|nr:cadherin domain-containing protein [Bradyrhizobium semiaridum]MCA6125559.1 cadherin domain-containing protein [Bradyrhizobium semiaridum]